MRKRTKGWKRWLHRLYTPSVNRKRFSLGDREQPSAVTEPHEQETPTEDFTNDTAANAARVEKLFHYPRNNGLHSHTLSIQVAGQQGQVAHLLYLVGLIDLNLLDQSVTAPLQQASLTKHESLLEQVRRTVIPSISPTVTQSLEEVRKKLLGGHLVLFLPGEARGLLIDLHKVPARQVDEPKTELVIRGSHEGFSEDHDKNVSLIQKRVQSANLMIERVEHEGVVRAKLSICYFEGVTNTKLIDEVKRRVASIRSYSLITSGMITQMLEDAPYTLVPTLTVTERPDRAGAMILDGHVIVVVDNSPFVLICPTTFWTLFHTSEEYELRTFYANFIRVIRVLACFFALYAPGLYIALTNYQPEMIPTDLMLAIAGSREMLPFPTFFEILIMEFAFELIREAGIRIPAVIGSTIGIVGALILGQAAVQANIISPLLVILVSITGLGSFAIPNQDLGFAIRIFRFVLLVLGGMFGFLGISAGTLYMLAHLVSLQSFGVPFMAPRFPRMKANFDFIFRQHLWAQRLYGRHLRPQTQKRYEDNARRWDRPIEEGEG